jgi:hypothetical protein
MAGDVHSASGEKDRGWTVRTRLAIVPTLDVGRRDET